MLLSLSQLRQLCPSIFPGFVPQDLRFKRSREYAQEKFLFERSTSAAWMIRQTAQDISSLYLKAHHLYWFCSLKLKPVQAITVQNMPAHIQEASVFKLEQP